MLLFLLLLFFRCCCCCCCGFVVNSVPCRTWCKIQMRHMVTNTRARLVYRHTHTHTGDTGTHMRRLKWKYVFGFVVACRRESVHFATQIAEVKRSLTIELYLLLLFFSFQFAFAKNLFWLFWFGFCVVCASCALSTRIRNNLNRCKEDNNFSGTFRV